MLKPLQQIGLLHLEPGALRPVDNATLNVLKDNTEQMVRAINQHQIPGVLIPAVGNLQAEPYGTPEVTERWWRGLQMDNGPRKWKLLRQAADAEWLTPDIRLKQRGRRAILESQAGGVTGFDLQSTLDDSGFPYDHSVFSDWLHFTPEGHRQVADAIAEELSARLTTVPQ